MARAGTGGGRGPGPGLVAGRLPRPGQPVPGAIGPGWGRRLVWLAATAPPVLCASISGMLRVLRLCSVFEPRELSPAWVAYDPIGGMQNHAAELTRCLDRLGVAQMVVTSRLAGPADSVRFGAHGQVIRTGLRVPVLRQGWALLAARHVLGGGPVDLVHVHCGEDLAVLPLAWLAARRHGCLLVATVHLSVRHGLRPVAPRGVLLRAAGGTVERWLLPGADAVIALTPSTARQLRADGIPAGPVHVIPPGYDPALFARAYADPFPGLPAPVVATRVGGTADLVHDGVNGLLVAPRDPAALAAAISRILADPATAARLSAAARRTAAAYAWTDLARAVLDVYRQATGPGRGSAG